MVMLLGFAGLLVFFVLRWAIFLAICTAVGYLHLCRLAVIGFLAAARAVPKAVASLVRRRGRPRAFCPFPGS